MRALPGPTSGVPGSAGPGRPPARSGDAGWEPQPNVWLIPAGLAVLFVAGAWACDEATAALVGVTGSGEATHYLPMALGLLAVLAVLAVAVFRRDTARARQTEAALSVAEEAEARALPGVARTVTVTAEALNMPRALPAHPAATYPMPQPVEIIDAEIIP